MHFPGSSNEGSCPVSQCNESSEAANNDAASSPPFPPFTKDPDKITGIDIVGRELFPDSDGYSMAQFTRHSSELNHHHKATAEASFNEL